VLLARELARPLMGRSCEKSFNIDVNVLTYQAGSLYERVQAIGLITAERAKHTCFRVLESVADICTLSHRGTACHVGMCMV
jgi:hypothetical protein